MVGKRVREKDGGDGGWKAAAETPFQLPLHDENVSGTVSKSCFCLFLFCHLRCTKSAGNLYQVPRCVPGLHLQLLPIARTPEVVPSSRSTVLH